MICLLCVSADSDSIHINGEEGILLGVADVINKHFWFQLDLNETDTKSICKQCWQKILEFHMFYTEIEECHKQGNLEEFSVVDYVDVLENSSLKQEIEENDEIKQEDEDEDDEVEADIQSIKYEPTEEITFITSLEIEFATDPTTSDQADKQARQKKNNLEQHKIAEICKMQCEKCERIFKDWADVRNHYQQVHKVHGYLVCICCNMKFRKRCHILDHVQFRANPEAFQCDVCKKQFDRREALQKHVLLHVPSEDRMYKCDLCQRGYTSKGLLAAHIRLTHVAQEDKKFVCPDCGTRHVTEAIMNSHIKRKHLGAYSKICEICAKVLPTRLDYERHKANKHGPNPLPKVQCVRCKKWLRESSVNSHAQCCRERPNKGIHVCEICQKECPSIRALNGHRRYVHVIQRDFQCNVCEKSFKRAINLKEHYATHTGEQLYTCTFCPKTFNSNANWLAHRKKMHKEELLLMSQNVLPNV